MKVDLIANPAAGGGRAADDVVRLLAEIGHEVRHRSTSDDWHALLQDPGDLLVAAGGDGTVRDVALAAADGGVPFAILPFGTANNIAKSLGMVGSARDLAASWTDPDARRPFDLGTARAAGGSVRFVEGIGGGLFADLIAHEEQIGSGAGLLSRETDQALHLLGELLREQAARPWRIEADGRDLSGDYLIVEILNTRFGGPNVPLAPAASTDDGLLDVVTVPTGDRDGILAYLDDRLQLASGRMPRLPSRRARAVRVQPPPDVRLRFDDELWDPGDRSGWLEVACLAGAATLVGAGLRPSPADLSGPRSSRPERRADVAPAAPRPSR